MNQNFPHVIETERLFLREMDHSDFDALYDVLADSDIMRHYPYTFDGARVRRWIDTNIRRYEVYGFGLWAVCLRESGEMIGDCGITMQNINGFIRPEIGYHIKASEQRKGYASEAAKACIDLAFSRTPFLRLFSYMHADNIPSAKTAQKCGMTLFEQYTDPDEGEILVYSVKKPQ